MKLLIDMNLSPRWVEVFNGAGIEAVHWIDAGRPDAADSEIMSFASQYGYVVLTHDLDFSAILAATQGIAPSVVQIRSTDVSPNRLGERVVALLREHEELLARGALVTVDIDRQRVRLLPLLPFR